MACHGLPDSTCAGRYVVPSESLLEPDRISLTARLPVFVVQPGSRRPTRDVREQKLWRKEARGEYVSVPRAWGMRRFGLPEVDARKAPDRLPEEAVWAGPDLRPHQVGGGGGDWLA